MGSKGPRTGPRPPRWAARLLKCLSRPYLRSPALGDLEEIYLQIIRESGKARADSWFRRQAVKSVPSLLNIRMGWSLNMLKNHLKTAGRNMQRHKGYTLINIGGLAVGMACCILILMFVTDELSYDDFHVRADRIFRANTISSLGSNTRSFAVVPAVFPKEIEAALPEIQSSTRMFPVGSPMFRADAQPNELSDLILVDPGFFQIFSYSFLAGDPATALASPDSLVLTEELALRFFGSRKALGKTLFPAQEAEASRPFRITGIIRDLPKNSHLQFKSIASIDGLQYMLGADEPPEGLLDPYYCRLSGYFLFKPGIDGYAQSGKINAVAQEKWAEIYKARGTTREFYLLNIRDIHLRSPNQDEPGGAGDIQTVYLFAAIALMVLLIASFNFINLSTARASRRALEVGVRKVLGSRKGQLVRQFLSESLILSMTGLAIGLLLVISALPAFNRLLQKELALSALLNSSVLMGILGIVILNGLIAGSFPAVILSSFDPVRALKGRLLGTARNISLRKILVVFQFAITIFLIVGVLAIIRQLDYIKNKDLGFDKQRVAVINSGLRSDTLRERILSNPHVEAAAFSANVPGVFIQYMPLSPSLGGPVDGGERVELLQVGYDFLATYGMTIKWGRTFSREFSTDEDQAVVINEKTADLFGWQDDAVGKTLYDVSADNHPYTVVGVVKDFHQANLRQVISPVVLDLNSGAANFISVKIADGRIPETITFLEDLFHEVRPEQEFNYDFIDDAFRRMYPEADRFRQLYLAFGVLAVFVACLGLFGLASFNAARRTKEIGVRKVLGASVHEIVLMLSREFTTLILAANVIAWPLAYLVMRRWLGNYAYRIALGLDIFFFAGALTVAIALLTISAQSFKAAVAPPVSALRYE